MDYPLNYWAPVPLSQINMASVENLGQTSGDYPIYRQNLGWSAKSKIPVRLGFSRHMKTRAASFSKAESTMCVGLSYVTGTNIAEYVSTDIEIPCNSHLPQAALTYY